MSALVHLTLAAMLAGVALEERISPDGETLALASCGVRDTLWMDHYAAGLYLPPGASVHAVRDPGQPKAVRMKVIDARHFPDDIPEKWRHVLQRELQADPMSRVREAYGRLADDDVVTVSYAPQQGVAMRVNREVIAKGLDHAVIAGMLDAWAEHDPISQKLHRLALEHPC